MGRTGRIVGLVLIVAGVLTLTWVVVVWQWQDPFTALYTHVQQNRLAHRYERRVHAYNPRPTQGKSLAAVEVAIAAEARAYHRGLHTGDPIGRLQIGRIGLKMVVVQGTDHETLKKGPGHYEPSGLPGEGHLIYIAGHRTTYLAPFAHINDIEVGDYVTFSVPYATFTYRVQRHYIVRSDQVSVLKDHGREILRLQACHPRFFATHRYIAYARLVRFSLPGGRSFALTA